MQIETYSVLCDACRGRLFDENGVLCWKCSGDGQVLITEHASSHKVWTEAVEKWLRAARSTLHALRGIGVKP